MQVPLQRGDCNYTAHDPQGHDLAAALLATDRRTLALQALMRATRAPEATRALARYTLALTFELPPLGFSSLFLAPSHRAAGAVVATAAGDERPPSALQPPPLPACAAETALYALAVADAYNQRLDPSALQTPPLPDALSGPRPLLRPESTSIENEHLKLELSGLTGTLEAVTLKATGERIPVALDLVYWQSVREGGAYIMRPSAQVRHTLWHSVRPAAGGLHTLDGPRAPCRCPCRGPLAAAVRR